MLTSRKKVLIWGIAGASLGMEIAKSLAKDGGFDVVGVDISPFAYGHFAGCFRNTYVLNEATCASDVCTILADNEMDFLIAGGDIVARLCADIESDIRATGATYAGNNRETVRICSDKYSCFALLAKQGITTPNTFLLSSPRLIEQVAVFPVIVKPRLDSGGSRGIRIFHTQRELTEFQLQHAADADKWVCQEYLHDFGNELTIGVLSQTNGRAAGAIVLRRTFQCVLSVHDRSQGHLISSGSSQGEFYRDRNIEHAAITIADAVGSTGPLNIQCRLKDGMLFPFEINPRFSASTFLRTLAGVNEVAIYLRHLSSQTDITYPAPREGLALRSFAECFVPRASQ